MSQPVKLSDDLILDARLVGEISQRSLAGQIEFWASLGRALEPLLTGASVLALRRSGKLLPLSELLASVDAPDGKRRVAAYLASQPFPHYEPAPDQPGLLVRIEADGRTTIGKFVNRQFQSVEFGAAKSKSRLTKRTARPKKKKRASRR
jgi:hypothetical protein